MNTVFPSTPGARCRPPRRRQGLTGSDEGRIFTRTRVRKFIGESPHAPSHLKLYRLSNVQLHNMVHLSPQTDTTHPSNSQCNTHHQGWSIFGHQPGEELLHLPVTSPQLPAVSAAKRSSFPVPATVIVVHVVLLPRPSAMKGCAAVCVLLRRS